MCCSITNIEVNEGIIKFKNRRCFCRKKVIIKISKSTTNPSKLYFFCETGKCKCNLFWALDNEEYNMHGNANSQDRRSFKHASEIKLNEKMNAINVTVHTLEEMYSILNMMILNLDFFGISISVLIWSTMKL